MKAYSCEAWILRMKPYGEYDALVSAYSHERGRINGYVKGVRKMGSKLRAGLVPFTKSQLHIMENATSGLAKIIGAVPMVSYAQLYNDLEKLHEATWVCDMVNQLTPLDQKSNKKYDLLEKAFQTIALTTGYLKIRISVIWSLLEFTGHGLEVHACSECGSSVPDGEHVWIANSGIICRLCKDKVTYKTQAPRSVAVCFKELKNNPWLLECQAFNKVELNAVYSVMRFIVNHYLQRPLQELAIR